MGYVIAPHGAKGKVKVEVKGRMEKILPILSRIIIGNKEYKIAKVKRFEEVFIIGLKGIRKRDDAENLRAQNVFVLKVDIPKKTRIETGIEPAKVLLPTNVKPKRLVGMVAKPHGVHGSVKVVFYTPSTEMLEGRKAYIEEMGKYLETKLKDIRVVKRSDDRAYAIVKLEGVEDRTQAEVLRKRSIWI